MKKHSLFKYTWPIFVELILQFLVGNVDQIMANTVSEYAVSAISNANQILFVLLITFTIISLAITILATQYYGRKEIDNVGKVYAMGLIVNGVFGLIITILIFFFAKPLFIMMDIPKECLKESLDYLYIINFGMVIQALYITYVAIFRTKAWMKQTMYVSVFMNGLNIIGNLLLIPSLGVIGAAISSDIAKLIGLVLLIVYFHNASDVRIDFKSLRRFDTKLFNRIMAIGFPAGAESICYDLSQLVILKFVNSFGNLVIKTRSFANMIANFSFMFGSAISQAVQIIVGFEIGAKNYEEADKQVKKTMFYSIVIGSGVSFIIYLFSDQVFGLFISGKEQLAIAKQIMFVEIFLEASRAVNMTMVRSLQACGDTKAPAIIGMISMWGIATLLSYIFGIVFNMGVVGVWIAMCLDESIRAVIFIIRWNKGKWKTISI